MFFSVNGSLVAYFQAAWQDKLTVLVRHLETAGNCGGVAQFPLNAGRFSDGSLSADNLTLLLKVTYTSTDIDAWITAALLTILD